MNKPFSEACERNKEPLYTVLSEVFSAPGEVLEIGSGTGQHGVFFAERMPHLIWQTSDREENRAGIRQWGIEAALSNWRAPLMLDVLQVWPEERYDYAFSANTAHIMSWQAVEAMFEGLAQCLKPGGRFCLYGPFNYQGQFTSESNARFNDWLKERDPASGIRDFEQVMKLIEGLGWTLLSDIAMPANNRCLVFEAGN